VTTAEHVTIAFGSSGLPGRLLRPAKGPPCPAVLLCYGCPGLTKSEDLAEELARHGVAALLFNYPGAWGAPGTYRLAETVPAARAAYAYLRSCEHIDEARLAIFGHSFGAIPAVSLAATLPELAALVLAAPVPNLLPLVGAAGLAQFVSFVLALAPGRLARVTADGLRQDLSALATGHNPWDRLAACQAPIRIVAAGKDTLPTPAACTALAARAAERCTCRVIEGAEHDFAAHRRPLVEDVLSFLLPLLLAPEAGAAS
jgi:dienelactone hydrolase